MTNITDKTLTAQAKLDAADNTGTLG